MPKLLTSKTFAVVLVLAVALAGCGGSGSSSTKSSSTSAATSSAATSPTASTAATSTTTTSSTTSSEKEPTIDIQMSSPVKLSPIAARYTCDGANTSPPLHWSGVPAGTKEIELFLFNLITVHGKLIASWSVAGLSPTLHGLPAGSLPPGAILGRNSDGHVGYSLCPPRGKEVRLAFLMYALPEKLSVRPGFDTEALRAKSLHIAKSAGLLGLGYKRR